MNEDQIETLNLVIDRLNMVLESINKQDRYGDAANRVQLRESIKEINEVLFTVDLSV